MIGSVLAGSVAGGAVVVVSAAVVGAAAAVVVVVDSSVLAAGCCWLQAATTKAKANSSPNNLMLGRLFMAFPSRLHRSRWHLVQPIAVDRLTDQAVGRR